MKTEYRSRQGNSPAVETSAAPSSGTTRILHVVLRLDHHQQTSSVTNQHESFFFLAESDAEGTPASRADWTSDPLPHVHRSHSSRHRESFPRRRVWSRQSARRFDCTQFALYAARHERLPLERPRGSRHVPNRTAVTLCSIDVRRLEHVGRHMMQRAPAFSTSSQRQEFIDPDRPRGQRSYDHTGQTGAPVLLNHF